MGARTLAWMLLAVAAVSAPAAAQEEPKPFKPEELDQLVAPIALHPDPLLAQIFMASTYPLEVVQAARFVKEQPNLKGDQLDEALKKQTWDDSVKSLVTFPQVLALMNEKLDWLQKLGDAFLAQQADLLAAVQRLRARAQAAGQLKDTKEQKVIVEPAAAPAAAPPPAAGQTPPPPPPATSSSQTVIRIEPADPQVVYVPTYNPTVVYGAWPPAYPPYYPYPAGYFWAGAFSFAAGVAVGGALWGHADWHGGEVNINNNISNNFSNRVNNSTEARQRVENRSRGQTGTGGQGKWQHNPEHRKGVQYRDQATQKRFDKGGPSNAQSREAFRGRSGQGSDVSRAGQQGGVGTGGGRGDGGPGQAGGRDRPGGAGQQPAGGIGDRGPGSSGAGVSDRAAGGGRQSGAFDGMGSGRDSQTFSNRGNSSRESFNRSSGGASRSGGGGGGARSGGGGGRGGGGRGGGGRR